MVAVSVGWCGGGSAPADSGGEDDDASDEPGYDHEAALAAPSLPQLGRSAACAVLAAALWTHMSGAVAQMPLLLKGGSKCTWQLALADSRHGGNE